MAWSFNGDAEDVSGNANDATLVGDTAFEAKFGQGIEMDNERLCRGSDLLGAKYIHALCKCVDQNQIVWHRRPR